MTTTIRKKHHTNANFQHGMKSTSQNISISPTYLHNHHSKTNSKNGLFLTLTLLFTISIAFHLHVVIIVFGNEFAHNTHVAESGVYRDKITDDLTCSGVEEQMTMEGVPKKKKSSKWALWRRRTRKRRPGYNTENNSLTTGNASSSEIQVTRKRWIRWPFKPLFSKKVNTHWLLDRIRGIPTALFRHKRQLQRDEMQLDQNKQMLLTSSVFSTQVQQIKQDNALSDWKRDSYESLETHLTPKEKYLVEAMVKKVKKRLGEENRVSFEERMLGVKWGGPGGVMSQDWWFPKYSNCKREIDNSCDFVDGWRLIIRYMNVMNWPNDLFAKFPYPLCAEGCEADFAIEHTLEWREKYKPWIITPSMLRENKKGWMYVRGYSLTPYNTNNSVGGNTMLWYRPGLHKLHDVEGYLRVIMHNIDTCVADTLRRSEGKVGRCNVALDCSDFGFSMVPPISLVKRIVTMMQDHFPDRLGVLIIANMSRAPHFFLKLVLPFVTESSRRKIHILTNDSDSQMEMIRSLVDDQYIPHWFGGNDTYQFNSDAYYDHKALKLKKASDAEGLDYLQTMPYHA